MASALDVRPPQPPVVPSTRLRVRVADSLEAVEGLEPAWRGLDREIKDPLLQYAWIRSALAVFATDATPHVVAVTRSQQVVALAPFVKKRLHGVRRLFLAGVGELFEPGNLVWGEARALERLTSALVRSATPLYLERMTASSPALAKLKRRFWGRAVILTRPQAACPYIALDESWLTPEQHLNSGRRSDLRRARRKAEQSGPVTIEIHTPDLEELPHLLDTAFEVEARGWKGRARTALAHDAVRAVFYRQYAQTACTEGILRICFLRIGDRVAAMQLAIEYGGGFWLLKVGYDDRFAQCSPGLLLMRETIRYAVEAGLERYEFLGRAEAWTEVWTKTEHACVSLRIYPLGVRGLAALAADLGAVAYRKWREE